MQEWKTGGAQRMAVWVLSFMEQKHPEFKDNKKMLIN